MPSSACKLKRIGLLIVMPRFPVRFIGPESFVHNPSFADFIITTSGFEFSVRTGSRPLQLHRRGAREIADELAGRRYCQRNRFKAWENTGPQPVLSPRMNLLLCGSSESA